MRIFSRCFWRRQRNDHYRGRCDDSGEAYGKQCAESIIEKFHDKEIDRELIARIVALTNENFENMKRIFQSKGVDAKHIDTWLCGQSSPQRES
jgi:hypothetical protein